MVSRLLSIMSDGFGRAVELEFALTVEAEEGVNRGTFHLLQAHPMGGTASAGDMRLPAIPESRIVVRSSQAMGHRHIEVPAHLFSHSF